MTMYRLADDRGMPMGVFDTPEEAMCIVPEVADDWRPVKGGKPGDYDGWEPHYSFFRTKPHFTIRAVGEED
jgi:hypothetical protein